MSGSPSISVVIFGLFEMDDISIIRSIEVERAA